MFKDSEAKSYLLRSFIESNDETHSQISLMYMSISSFESKSLQWLQRTFKVSVCYFLLQTGPSYTTRRPMLRDQSTV